MKQRAVKFGDAQWEEIQRLAGQEGVSAGEWVREACDRRVIEMQKDAMFVPFAEVYGRLVMGGEGV